MEAYLYTCPFMRPVCNGVFYIYRLNFFCLPMCNAGLCYFVLFFVIYDSFILITTDKWDDDISLKITFNDKLLSPLLVVYLH